MCVIYNRIFANAKSLFYYVHRPRAAGKMLSQEQVAALLAQAEGRNTTDVTVVSKMAASSEVPSTTSTVSPVTEYEQVKNSGGEEDHAQGDVSLVKETSLVEVVTKKLNSDSNMTADKTDGEVSDVVMLSNSGGKPTGQPEDHVIQQQDHMGQQEGSSDHQQVDCQAAQEMVLEQEADHNTGNSTSSLADKAAPPTTVPTHTSPTFKTKTSKYVSQGSVFAELRSHNNSTSSSSPQLPVKKGRIAPWSRPRQQKNCQPHNNHTASKSRGLHHLEAFEEVSFML